MKILPPVSIEGRRLLPGHWDLLAAVLVLGFIISSPIRIAAISFFVVVLNRILWRP